MSSDFYTLLTKLSARKRDRTDDDDGGALRTGVKGVAGLVAGKKLITHGAERALGVHRLIHGTSERNAESILRSGFRDSYGASPSGSTANVGGWTGATFQAHNKGRIHMFKDNPLLRRFAAGHAYLSETGAGMDRFFPAILGLRRGGTTVGAVVGDQFFRDKYEDDPFHIRGAYRTAASARNAGSSDIGAERLTRGRVGLRAILKHRERGAALADYIKRDPRRFANGIGLTAAGGLAAYGGGRRLYRAVRARGSRSDREQLRREDQK